VHAALREIVHAETGIGGPEDFERDARMYESAAAYGENVEHRPAIGSQREPQGRKPILFLDLDGVFLIPDGLDHRGGAAFALAPGSVEFIHWASTRFRPFWLSTRSRSGSPDDARRALRLARGPALLEADQRIMHAIPAIEWSTCKVAAMVHDASGRTSLPYPRQSWQR